MAFKIITVPDTEVHLDNPSEFHTTKELFDLGMCACNSCGKLHSIDYRFCKKCNIEIIIILR